ncbi:MAG: hypothetical protein CL463_06240 [Acidimicrobiaceae bacterium]|nr:hypothetical protein [Acidimicrobiaceae bacterium]
MDDSSNAPKFHMDRSQYGEGLQQWFEDAHPHHTNVSISDIDIPVATGFSNETVFFEISSDTDDGAHNGRYVARIEPEDGGMFPVQTPDCETSVALQQRVMTTVQQNSDVPIPTLGKLITKPYLGLPFFVMVHVDGKIPSDRPRYTEEGFVVDEATEQQRTQMVQTGLEAMAGIHQIDWETADLHWLNPCDGTPTQIEQIQIYRRYVEKELAGRDHPVMDHALDWLDANNPHDDRIGLSWGDARLGNIIWEDYTPAAVVDWEACALSPTEADLGWWLMFDRMSFDDVGVERLPGYPTREEQATYYETVSGREVRDPHYWEVFAVMRFCAIFIRLGDRLTNVGLFPPESNPAVGNMVTQSLATLLEIENPTPSLI